MLNLIQSYKYEITAFVAGMSVMMLEIVGARRIAPYFGSSVYVWTAMIGVILGALALGYWYGGRLADRRAHNDSMILVFVIAAVLILASVFVEDTVLGTLASANFDLRLSSFIAALLLFAPPALFIGMISPHLAKVRLRSLETTGRTIGRLEASGTIGSIAGTFLCGYILLSLVGSRTITLSIVVILIAASFLLQTKVLRAPRIFLAIIAVLLLITPLPSVYAQIVADIDTAHARYRVLRAETTDGPVHYLTTSGDGIQSASYINDPTTPALRYIQRLTDVTIALPSNNSILMIGGGAHTLPMVLHDQLPESRITVAEIDPGLDAIAQAYFGFEPDPAIQIIYKDGRDFLRTNTERYDVLLVDAYSSLTPPFHLTTREAVEAMKTDLQPDGLIAANVIGSEIGRNKEYLQRILGTYGSVFRYSNLYPIDADRPSTDRQNYILIATDSAAQQRAAQSVFTGPDVLRGERGQQFTDDFAPVESLSF